MKKCILLKRKIHFRASGNAKPIVNLLTTKKLAFAECCRALFTFHLLFFFRFLPLRQLFMLLNNWEVKVLPWTFFSLAFSSLALWVVIQVQQSFTYLWFLGEIICFRFIFYYVKKFGQESAFFFSISFLRALHSYLGHPANFPPTSDLLERIPTSPEKNGHFCYQKNWRQSNCGFYTVFCKLYIWTRILALCIGYRFGR